VGSVPDATRSLSASSVGPSVPFRPRRFFVDPGADECSSSFFAPLRRLAVWAFACLSALASQALAAQTSVNFGTVPVGQTTPAQTVTVNFSQSGQIKAIKAMLQGATGLDYAATGGSCQAGTTYQAGESCTVQASFKPLAPGARNGAIVLENPAGATIATAYLTGIGQGPFATFPGGTPIIAGYIGINSAISSLGWTIDGAGNMFLTYQNQLIKVDPSGVVSLLATIPNTLLAGVAALGNGNLVVGAQAALASSAPYYLVQPNGTWSLQGTITDPVESPFIDDVAIGPSGETYLGTNHSVYNSSSGRICPVPNERGLAMDASGTLLTGTPTNQSYYPNPTATAPQPCRLSTSCSSPCPS
jgi:hypothetical protein